MTVKPKLLDLFCGAGGASRGYVDAGFDVIGVDLEAQPSYPYRFIRDDAMRLVRSSGFLAQFDAVHASPPCHDHSALRSHTQRDHGTGWMLEATIEALESSGLPFIVENVERADMAGRPFITLCGSQFDLKVRRHRRFATNFTVQPPPVRPRRPRPTRRRLRTPGRQFEARRDLIRHGRHLARGHGDRLDDGQKPRSVDPAGVHPLPWCPAHGGAR